MTNNDEVRETSPEAAPDPQPAKLADEGASAERRGFLHRLASFGLGEGPAQLLVPRTELKPADLADTGD